MQALYTVIMTQRFVAVKKIQTRFELSRDQEFVSKKGVYSRWLSEIYYDILRWWVSWDIISINIIFPIYNLLTDSSYELYLNLSS